jgi:hypothetical protein
MYFGKELDDISRDRDRLRAYFWRVAMNARRIAARNRRSSRATGVSHPVTNYRAAFDEGYDLLRWAGVLERVSAIVLDNLDALVESTYEGEP